MAETRIETKPRRRGGWLKILAVAVGVLLVLVAVAFFVVTSGAFVKGVILPRVGDSMNAELTASSVDLSLFSSLELRDVKLTPKSRETLFTANLVRARYGLREIIGGKIAVAELTVESPTITLVENSDGTSNLDPLLKEEAGKAKEKKPSKETGKPPSVDVKLVSIKDGTVRRVTKLKEGGQDTLELSNVNLTLADLRNGQSGKMDLSALVAMDNAARKDTPAASLRANVTGGFAFDLTPDLKPASVKGNTILAVGNATGPYAEMAGLTTRLDCEATPTEIKQLALRFLKADATLAELRVSGPFDAAKSEGRLKVELSSLDRKLLNVFGAKSGLDFGTTTINAASDVELSKGGKEVSLAGRLDLARFQVTRQNQTTPTLDLNCQYNLIVNNETRTATFKTLDLTGKQNSQPLLRADLSSPMTIAWGDSTSAVGDAALNLELTGLNLADWRPFAADLAPEGLVNLKGKVVSKKGGKQLTFEFDGGVQNLAAKMGAQSITGADVKLTARGNGADLKQFYLDEFRLSLAQQGQSALTVSGKGTFDSATKDADLEVAVQAVLGRLLAMFPQPDAKFSGGTMELKGRVAKKKSDQSVIGQLTLAGLNGSYGNYRFADFGSTVDLDVAKKNDALEIKKASGELHEGAKPGGKFDVSGNLNLTSKAGQLALKLADFNQNGLRPFLESALGDKKLVSITIDSTASATFASNGDAAVKGDFQLANLVVHDPNGALTPTALEAKAQVDASAAKSVAQIRRCKLTLTPTARAKNELDLSGSVDFSKSNAITGNLKLTSDSFDLTRYYDLFADKPKAGETNVPASTPAAKSPTTDSANKEPDPIKLPFRDFTMEAAVGHFYLREVDAANVQVMAKLDGSRVVLKPAQLTLNGAPVSASADLDLSVPGYKYDVAFNASAVPVTPLVNSFAPERKGQMGGTTTASAQIKGEGTTGANLKKHLAGKFNFMSTNLNLAVANVRNPLINGVISVIDAIPNLIRNPTAAAGNLLGGLVGGGTTKGGWTRQLAASPIDVIMVAGNAADGHVTLDQSAVRSSAFEATANGDITLAEVLTNSAIRIPVNVALSRELGSDIGLVTANTPTNMAFVAMPQFLTMKGTLGKPKRDINEMALLGLAAKVGGSLGKSIGGDTGGKVGGVLDAVGGLLGGKQAAVTNAPTTNAPGTNVQQPNQLNDLLNIFTKPKK